MKQSYPEEIYGPFIYRFVLFRAFHVSKLHILLEGQLLNSDGFLFFF
jgi:hypothetical protein